MEKAWRQILAAVLAGWVIPQLFFRMASRPQAEVSAPTETTAATVQTNAETVFQPGTVTLMYIPVITGSDKVRIMELEDYIRGVVLAEMPASFETEALKAQAVAARTYTLRRMTVGDKHTQGAVCTDSTCCQAYLSDEEYLDGRGNQTDIDKVAAAVAATAGEVLTYDGELIEATYFAASGGRTEDAAAVWGSDIPYLQAVDSPGETKAENYAEKLYFTKKEFAAMLGRKLSGSPESWLGEVEYTGGGGVQTMVIGGMTYTGTQLRKLLDLNSTVFTMAADADGITVETKGWGHRVGLSQYGADAMAVAGSTYRQILLYYYQGTEIDKIGELG